MRQVPIPSIVQLFPSPLFVPIEIPPALSSSLNIHYFLLLFFFSLFPIYTDNLTAVSLTIINARVSNVDTIFCALKFRGKKKTPKWPIAL